MIDEPHQPVADLIRCVRRRWRRRIACEAVTRAALAATAGLAVALALARWLPAAPAAPAALAALGVGGLGLVVAALMWGLGPAARVPSDARIARFIEERRPDLDDRLTSAVHLSAAPGADQHPALAASMLGDASRAAASIDPREVVPAEALRRVGIQAAAAVALLATLGVAGRGTVRASFDALSMVLWPSGVVLEVSPGNARVEAGSSLTVVARLVGSTAPVVARFLRSEGEPDNWRAVDMQAGGSGRFTASLDALAMSFRYKVVAGPVASKTFDVSVVRAPRVTRIDVEYAYPKALGLPPRVEKDGGDIYAPLGTDVRVRVHTDIPASSGQMTFPDGKALALSAAAQGGLHASLQIAGDTSYRVALADAGGLGSKGDTEYFIRTLDDRPPDVRLTRPASDRRVTPLEEVDIEAEATDDFGLASVDLVYAMRGGVEQIVPLRIPPRATSARSRHTLFLEDLDVRPGDFISYYVRARDLGRGRQPSEARSDIFFLEVKPFEEVFTLAESQAAMGGGQANQQLDDLVAAQKQIIVATWKLDRRSREAHGVKSAEDIRTVARAEHELETRVEQASSAFRQSTMRDPRRRPTGGLGLPPSTGPRAGQMLDEENAMTLAAAAMRRAVGALGALKTGEAVPPEMEALQQLLKAQADLKKRQILQQAGGGGGGNRSSQDLSSLFDKELARHQQTNYETPQRASDQKGDQKDRELDAIRELAQRQDELLKRQQALARDREQLPQDVVTRELEKLTREQDNLRQRAEELAQQMSRPEPGGQPRESGQGQGQMRSVSEQMRGAERGLRSQDAEQARTRGARALQKLRDLEGQLEAISPDGRRRALGDLQLETRQLAEAERQMAGASAQAGEGESGKDARRRLAGEQERLSARARRVQEGLMRQAAARETGAPGGRGSAEARRLQQAAANAARELDRQRLADRMEEMASAMREGSDPRAPSGGGAASAGDVARAFDRIADSLAEAARPSDGPSQTLTGQLARARELRERLDDVTRQLDRLGQEHDRGEDGSRPPGGPAGPGGVGDAAAEAERARTQIAREMRDVRERLDQLNRASATTERASAGRTFEGQGMTLSAPGTEAFKQDFARWQELKRQATAALDHAEITLTKALQAQEAKDRLAAGVDDSVPAAYEQHVDSYFKALAARKKP